MNATNGGPKRRAHNAQAVAALFFPGTLVGRLAFVGVIAFNSAPNFSATLDRNFSIVCFGRLGNSQGLA